MPGLSSEAFRGLFSLEALILLTEPTWREKERVNTGSRELQAVTDSFSSQEAPLLVPNGPLLIIAQSQSSCLFVGKEYIH